MSSKTARIDASAASGPPPAFAALPVAILNQVFAYASALDGHGLDGSDGSPDVFDDVPSMRLRKSTDAKDCSRIATVIGAAGMAFLRPVSKTFRAAADEVAVRVHVEAFGLPPADATTTERPPWGEPESGEEWEPWTRPCDDSDDSFDDFYPSDDEIFRYYATGSDEFDARTRRVRIVPFSGPPQAALVDRVHALLALRSANFNFGRGCDCCWESRYGEALARTFWARAATMPWCVEAWHVYVASPEVVVRSWGRETGDELEFDPWAENTCQRLRAFALALVPSESRSKIAVLPEKDRPPEQRLTRRVDLFGAATHTVDFAADLTETRYRAGQPRTEPHRCAGQRVLVLRGKTPITRTERCGGGWWDGSKIDEQRNEPPSDVIQNFCAFSFRPYQGDVHHSYDEDDVECYYTATTKRRGGFAVRAADLCSPNAFRDSDDEDSDDDEREPSLATLYSPGHGKPVLLRQVCFEQGCVHLTFQIEGSPLTLTVSGRVCAMPPPEDSDAYALRHKQRGSKADEEYFKGLDDGDDMNDKFWDHEAVRRRKIAKAAEKLRMGGLPRCRGARRNPTLSGTSRMGCG